MIEKCDAIEDAKQSADKAHLPIEGLAELGHGHVTEAIRAVNRFLCRLNIQ